MEDRITPDDARIVEPGEVLLMEPDRQSAAVVKSWLEAMGCRVFEAANPTEARVLAERHSAHVLFADERTLGSVGAVELQSAKGADGPNDAPVLILTNAAGGPDAAKRALDAGAFDFVPKPFDLTRVTAAVNNALRHARLSRQSTHWTTPTRTGAFDSILGRSDPMKTMFDQVQRVLSSTVPVFLSGESGTGKELVAHCIHDGGARKEAPFVELNCAAIPESLQESELFGHERGAFTGAVGTHKGKFEQAHGGTLFLDEIGEISLAVQARLLRVLQDGSLTRVGGTRPIQVDVRIVSATHRDIEGMVRDGRFRQDLYYRIVVYAIRIPPLRDRLGDVPLLLNHFLRKHRQDGGERIKAVAPEVLDLLCRHSWPGNVRELENTVRRALLLTDGDIIGLQALPPAVRDLARPESPSKGEPSSPLAVATRAATVTGDPLDAIVPLEELERQAILRAIALTGGNLTIAAERLGIAHLCQRQH